MVNIPVAQPHLRGAPPRGDTKSRMNFEKGSRKSQLKLESLNFDPITELVIQYRKIQWEIAYQEKLRSQEIVELTGTGKPRAYRAEIHQTWYDKQIKIGESLLRYCYGRVPETVVLDNERPSSLIINLTPEGQVYKIGEDYGGNGETECPSGIDPRHLKVGSCDDK